jgi:hypothetical protein
MIDATELRDTFRDIRNEVDILNAAATLPAGKELTEEHTQGLALQIERLYERLDFCDRITIPKILSE